MNRLLSLGAGLLVTSLGGSAFGYCRTTTCDPYVSCAEDPEQCCKWNSQGCDINGRPVSWFNACVSYSIYDEDSEDRDLTAQQLSEVTDEAFDNWLSVDCGHGKKPSLSSENFGLSYCGTPTFNRSSQDANSNVWMFRDGTWPHAEPGQDVNSIDASALALTTLTFNWKTAEILDADVELNTAQANFTITEGRVDIDLASIVTHESGHFLGLDHSADHFATMASGYNPGTLSPRTLSEDDEKAICAVYPPDRETASNSCQAYGEYSEVCHRGLCGIAQGPARLPPHWFWIGSFGIMALWVARRRRWARAES